MFTAHNITRGLVLIAVILLVVFVFVYSGRTGDRSEDLLDNNTMSSSYNPTVLLKTSMGDITLELFMDKTPITAGNFIKLANEGFYNNTKFHRVIAGFMIQGGDPNTKGDDVESYGRGGPGYTIEDEFDASLSNLRGTISMANTGVPKSGGSQFFINVANNVGLDFDKPPATSNHAVFGRVIEGMDVVDAISKVKTGAADRPTTAVVINKVVVNDVSLENEPIKTTDDERLMEGSDAVDPNTLEGFEGNPEVQ